MAEAVSRKETSHIAYYDVEGSSWFITGCRKELISSSTTRKSKVLICAVIFPTNISGPSPHK